MRGNTIKLKEKDNTEIRRSTKHLKIGRKCYNVSKKWDALFNYYLGEDKTNE